ncbi:Lrp/AsnC family transcriptional regulator [Candidatus Thorarchaeota archaeon]|nr:MAG: Lrp/AsnC family transcriptional regulator [Candidatus Thorarchaeota archaeon]
MIAIVLIKTEAGKAFSACTDIGKLDGITRAHVVTGPYDLVAVVDSSDISLRCLVAAIHDTKGVQRTQTCIAVS